MKKITILVFALAFPLLVLAQSPIEVSLNRLKVETQATIHVDEFLGNANFIHFPKEKPLALSGSTAIEKVNAFFDQYEGVFILPDDPSHWIETTTTTDAVLNSTHITLSQHKNNIQVYGSELKFHFDKEMKLTAVNGFVYPNINSQADFQIDEDRAKELAISIVESKYDGESNAPLFINEITLVYYREGTIQNRPFGRDHLVYHAEVKNNSNIREYIFIDAHTGKEIESYSSICNAINRTLYDGGLNGLEWQEGDAIEPLSYWKQREVIVSGQTYNFFKNAFDFISYDNNDAEMIIIHAPTGMNCPNANWNGYNINVCQGMAADDVIGHEWAHAYTDYTSNLVNIWQSGALNEAFSDIWGETIDLINEYDDDTEDLSLRTDCNSSERWMLGEDALVYGGATRDMWIPNCFGDPGAVSDFNYHCNESDNGGVHINSGIINRTYSLLVDGGDLYGQMIPSLGMTKTAHLFWRVQNTYLTPVSDFAVFADALEASCADLTGIDLEGLSIAAPAGLSGEVISAMDCDAVLAVINALSLSADPNCNFTTLLNTETPTLDCNNSNTILLEDFENGMAGWTNSAEPGNPSTWTFREWALTDDLPQDRPGTALFVPNPSIGNCYTDYEHGIVRIESPLFEMPILDDASFHLKFLHSVSIEPYWDGGNIKYSTNQGATWSIVPLEAFTYNGYNDYINSYAQSQNDNPMEGQDAFSGSDQGSLVGSWVESHVSLATLGVESGDDIIFRWELGTDGCFGHYGWFLDDVSIYTCSEFAVGTEDLIPTTQIQVSPNPFKDVIHIQVKGEFSGTSNIEIIDLSGKIVFSKPIDFTNNTSVVLNGLEHLPLGVYIVRFQGDNNSLAQKIVKI